MHALDFPMSECWRPIISTIRGISQKKILIITFLFLIKYPYSLHTTTLKTIDTSDNFQRLKQNPTYTQHHFRKKQQQIRRHYLSKETLKHQSES